MNPTTAKRSLQAPLILEHIEGHRLPSLQPQAGIAGGGRVLGFSREVRELTGSSRGLSGRCTLRPSGEGSQGLLWRSSRRRQGSGGSRSCAFLFLSSCELSEVTTPASATPGAAVVDLPPGWDPPHPRRLKKSLWQHRTGLKNLLAQLESLH